MDNNGFMCGTSTLNLDWPKTSGPSAAMVPSAMAALEAHDVDGKMRKRFRPQEITVPLSEDENTPPVNTKVVICQLGDEDIVYKPKVCSIAPPIAKYSSLSTRIYKTFNATSFPQVTTTKVYEEHIRSFLGKELLYANITPVKTLHKHDIQWKNEPQEVQLGWAHVQVEAALQKSGQKGTFFYGDVDAVIIRLSS